MSMMPDAHSQHERELEYEAARDERTPLRVRGVGRVGGEPRALLLCFNESPTDDELRALHEHLRWWYEH